jgi:TRAP-type mannitol/chloroaromatic compound transport system permease large subunit
MFIDWIGIVFIMVPILAPIGPALGFDALLVWHVDLRQPARCPS